MISPDPETVGKTILDPFQKEFGLSPLVLKGAYIFHTSGIRSNAPAGKRKK